MVVNVVDTTRDGDTGNFADFNNVFLCKLIVLAVLVFRTRTGVPVLSPLVRYYWRRSYENDGLLYEAVIQQHGNNLR